MCCSIECVVGSRTPVRKKRVIGASALWTQEETLFLLSEDV